MRPTALQSEHFCNVLKSHAVGITVDKEHRRFRVFEFLGSKVESQNFSKFVSGGFLAVEKDLVPKGGSSAYELICETDRLQEFPERQVLGSVCIPPHNWALVGH